MRKVLFYVAAALIIVGAGIGVYLSSTEKGEEVTPEFTLVVNDPVDEVNVERCISLDREYMTLNYGEYKWFETCILMTEYLDSVETKVAGVSNVFQVQKKSDRGTSVSVYCIAHTLNGTDVNVKKNAFWVEDFDLSDKEIVLTFDEALSRLRQANYRLPHSRYCVLRAAVGPIPNVNAQYIFGNKFCHYYVDAVTGAVTDVDPTGLPEDEGKPYLVAFEGID